MFERYHTGWEARDSDRIAELQTVDSMFHVHSGRPPVRGRAAIREAAAGMFALVPDLAFEFVPLRTGEDFRVVQWKLTGTTVTGAAVGVDLADFVVGRRQSGEGEALLRGRGGDADRSRVTRGGRGRGSLRGAGRPHARAAPHTRAAPPSPFPGPLHPSPTTGVGFQRPVNATELGRTADSTAVRRRPPRPAPRPSPGGLAENLGGHFCGSGRGPMVSRHFCLR
ncbi:nuclear transport factor 2 family protein [Streptomyces sp. NPDC048045]|uniref:nuclear transport factor 2 family protein n=1 Tax=Streptomyces sp. NPDC048045 TaxID=3154710 RepID=UPI00341A7062